MCSGVCVDDPRRQAEAWRKSGGSIPNTAEAGGSWRKRAQAKPSPARDANNCCIKLSKAS